MYVKVEAQAHNLNIDGWPFTISAILSTVFSRPYEAKQDEHILQLSVPSSEGWVQADRMAETLEAVAGAIRREIKRQDDNKKGAFASARST
jgi:hypothetical protein